VNKRIRVTVDPEHIDSEWVKIRTEIIGFGVKGSIHEKIKHQDEFTTFFDLIWESIGEDIKSFYLEQQNNQSDY